MLLPVGWADLKAHLVKIEDRDTGAYPFLSVSYLDPRILPIADYYLLRDFL